MPYSFYDFQKTELPTDKTWEFNPIKEVVYRDKIKKTPSFGRCFNQNYNMTQIFFRLNRARIKKKDDHVTIEINGLQGDGKSRVAQQISVKLGFKQSQIHIVFNPEEALKLATTLEAGHIIIIDDQREMVGVGATREENEIRSLIETVRAYGLSIILISPTPKNVDTSLHYRLEVINVNKRLRITKLGIHHRGSYAGYIVLDIPEDKDDPIYQAYLPLKEKFVKEDSLSREKNTRTDFKEIAFKVKTHKHWTDKIQRKSVEYIIREQNPRLTTEEVSFSVQSYLMYVGIKKQDLVKSTQFLKSKRYGFNCKFCNITTKSFKEKGQFKCPKCGKINWVGEHLGEIKED